MPERKHISAFWLFNFAADFAAIVAAYYTILFFRIHSAFGEEFFTRINSVIGVRETGLIPSVYADFYLISAPRIILYMTVVLCFLYAVMDLYPGKRFIFRRPLGARVVIANILALVLFYIYFYLSRNVHHPRSFFGSIILLNMVLCVLFRSGTERLLGLLRRRSGFDIVPAILAGSGQEADLIAAYLETAMPCGIKLEGRVSRHIHAGPEEYFKAIEKSVRESRCKMLILADTDLSIAEAMAILEGTDDLGLDVKVLSRDMAVLPDRARIWTDWVGGKPLVHFSRYKKVGATDSSNCFSRGVAFLLALAIIPFIALLALLVKLTSRGPVFFVQERIGVNRRSFLMFKFRTMYQCSDEMQAQLEEFNESGGALFKIRKDPRITPVGRFLRRFSLDELPQLINVIRGEMVFVGPRPLPKRDFDGYYEKWHYSRHGGVPGLTCLWQVSGRSDLDFQNMCVLDIYYLRNRTWILDIVILMRTAWVVLFARGAY